MHRTTIYLDEAVYQRIRDIAQASGRTQASVIREALVAYANGKRRPRPRSIGAGVGDKTLSDRAEELLGGFGDDRNQ